MHIVHFEYSFDNTRHVKFEDENFNDRLIPFMGTNKFIFAGYCWNIESTNANSRIHTAKIVQTLKECDNNYLYSGATILARILNGPEKGQSIRIEKDSIPVDSRKISVPIMTEHFFGSMLSIEQQIPTNCPNTFMMTFDFFKTLDPESVGLFAGKDQINDFNKFLSLEKERLFLMPEECGF